MRAALSVAGCALGSLTILSGCRDLAEPPMTRDMGPPPARRLASRPVVELPPAPGTAPRDVRDGGAIFDVEQPKAGLIVGTSATVPLFDPNMRYDRTAEVTLSGPIVGLTRIPLIGDRNGLFVRINAGGATPGIYLGPEEWLVFHNIRPSITQPLFVTGSQAELNGQIVIIARKVILNGVEISLRDPEGNPYWTEPSMVATTPRGQTVPANRVQR